ncbi:MULTISPECIES: hypothetical protein [Shewanella]|nr:MULTISPECIES: hypothetical protein [Shewanella]
MKSRASDSQTINSDEGQAFKKLSYAKEAGFPPRSIAGMTSRRETIDN